MSEIFDLYKNASLWVRFHNFIRWHTCPFGKIAEHVPDKGEILEVGCGYGLMSNLLSLGSSGRKVCGIDISPEKISEARKTLNKRERIQFEISDIYNEAIFENEKYSCIIIIGVLYLVPLNMWRRVFEGCYRALENGGVLLVKEQAKKPAWKYYWNRFQEFFAVRVFKITTGETFTFPDESTVEKLLMDAGFEVKLIRLDKGYLHPHILYVCKKING